VLERLVARGRARLVTTSGDSLNAPDTPDIARSDWLEGDTINVLFATTDSTSPAGVDSLVARIDSAAAPPDLEAEPESANAPAPRLEMLIARINARALYRLPPADTTAARDPACAGPGRFAVHYVVGDSITITMKDSEVDEMNVVGQVGGQHLEPPPCVPAQPADSAASTAPPGGAGQPQPAPAGGPPPPPPSGAAGEDATPPRGESLPPEPRTRSPSRRARPEPAVRR
jgi:hypothetical protein